MRVWSDSFRHGEPIPAPFAFGRRGPDGRFAPSDNRSPHLAWADLPAGTRSVAVVCHDPDVPSRPDDVNRDGRRVPADLPRVTFFHWLLMDLSPEATSLAEGAFSAGITPRGKPGPEVAGHLGLRHGVNDYTGWFAGDPDMGGTYFGYDGPCPPWNDTIVHHYHFTVYALDVARAPVDGAVGGAELLKAIAPHVLAQATVMGTYSIADLA
jgi:Raf kinase inhibitor-like YbhB/YbcL family protein